VPTEIELKFYCPPEFLESFKQLPILKEFGIAQPVELNLYSTYYDTPQCTLAQNRIGLRIRKANDHWIQTIKSGGHVQDGLHQHSEYEYTLSENQLDYVHIPNHLKPLFSDTQFRNALKPVFTTEFNRTIYLLEPQKNFQLECCLDNGVITANGKTDKISEIELELKSGEKKQLVEFSELLQKHCPVDLIPENASKASRGYALLKQ